MNIAGRTVLVSGAASGIGLACARNFSKKGAKIIGLDCNDELVNKLTPDLDFRLLTCDAADCEQVTAMFATLSTDSIVPDILVNNASILRDQVLVTKLGKKIHKHSLEDWEQTLASNLTSTFLLSREFAANLIELRSPGVIVNTSSVVRTGNPGQTAYSATKAAIDAMTNTWAQELSIYKIRVAAIAHGFAETGMTQDIPPLFRNKILNASTVRRFAEVDELVNGIQFIIENDYFAGRVLSLDGGMRF